MQVLHQLSKRGFMETQNTLRAAFISPESNHNLTRTIAAPPESIIFGKDAHFQHIRVIHIANNIFLVWPVIRLVILFFEERHTVVYKLSCSMTSLMRAKYIH